MSTQTPRGTRAHAPDLDWSQVRETVLMLELAAGQVEAAMRESNSSVDALTDTFTAMADSLRRVESAIASLPKTKGNAAIVGALREDTGQVSEKVHHAIIAFQFYDKLVQRLDHVCRGLEGLGRLVSDNGRLYNPSEWVALQEQIRSKYTMAEERAMFDAVIRGTPVREALETYMATRMQEIEESGGDIELF